MIHFKSHIPWKHLETPGNTWKHLETPFVFANVFSNAGVKPRAVDPRKAQHRPQISDTACD